MASTHSIAEYFKLYKNADFNNPDVRNTVLEYFVDRIYLFNDRITVLCWWDDLHEEVELEEIKNDIYAMSFDDGSVEFTDSVVISTKAKTASESRFSAVWYGFFFMLIILYWNNG